MNYNVEELSHTSNAALIRYGEKLFNNTPAYLGKEALDIPYVGNVLSCTNCHLEGGTKAYAIPMIGVKQRFPQYRGREDKIGTLEERINGCFERSMNGNKLPEESDAMKAFIAYIGWLSRYVEKEEQVNGKGLKSMQLPNRKVDLVKGEKIYHTICATCHGKDGQGIKIDQHTYEYPPLWGADSYNNGAGMTRVITAAQFIKYNMPYGTTYDKPLLTNDQAYDVAGFINQQTRPRKGNLNLDFPNKLKKPVSSPYLPFLDPFPINQHMLGPFNPIIDYYLDQHKILKTK